MTTRRSTLDSGTIVSTRPAASRPAIPRRTAAIAAPLRRERRRHRRKGAPPQSQAGTYGKRGRFDVDGEAGGQPFDDFETFSP